MSQISSFSIPVEQMLRLEFLLGEAEGLETLFPPVGPPVQFKAHVNGQWETCERFLRFDFYGEIPGIGTETFRAMISYSAEKDHYRMWVFASSQEEPLQLSGSFESDSLVLTSEPTTMIWGLQKLRFRLKPNADGSVELIGERFNLDEYVRYCMVTFRPCEVLSV